MCQKAQIELKLDSFFAQNVKIITLLSSNSRYIDVNDSL